MMEKEKGGEKGGEKVEVAAACNCVEAGLASPPAPSLIPPKNGGTFSYILSDWVSESVFPSGSLNHATCSPERNVQIPSSSCLKIS